MITIVKVYDKQVIGTHREYCGRPGKGQLGLLGNPFWMKDESQRNKVCDDYEDLTKKAFFVKGNIDGCINLTGSKDLGFKASRIYYRIIALINLAKTQDIELACFCQSPQDVVKKRCHCETIKTYIEEHLNTCLCAEITQISEERQIEGELNKPILTYVNGELVDARTLTM